MKAESWASTVNIHPWGEGGGEKKKAQRYYKDLNTELYTVTTEATKKNALSHKPQT